VFEASIKSYECSAKIKVICDDILTGRSGLVGSLANVHDTRSMAAGEKQQSKIGFLETS